MINPKYYDDDPIPFCNGIYCQQFDIHGSLCRKLGASTGGVCEPAVTELAARAAAKTVHIIFSNDQPRAAVFGTLAEAEKVRDRLRNEHWEEGKRNLTFHGCDRETYEHVVIWHIKDVEIMEG